MSAFSAKKYLKRVWFAVLIFVVETTVQLILIVISGLIFINPPVAIDFQTIVKDFLDTLNIFGTIKLIIFLPVYLIVYMLLANYREKVVSIHFAVQGFCWLVVCILFFPFVATANGLVMVFLALLGAYISIWLLNKFIFSKVTPAADLIAD